MPRFLQVQDNTDKIFEELCKEKPININSKDESEIYAKYIKSYIWVKI